MTTGAVRSPSAQTAQGELQYTDADFRRIASILMEDAGIALPATKAPLVYSRLAKRLRVLRIGTFKDYCNFVQSDEGATERREMMTALTTNVTHFFREPHHFEELKSRVAPPLLENARRGGRVRIWSAGSSTGQEVYSIAMTLLEMEPELAKYDVKLLATDIDPKVLEKGREGVYSNTVMANVSETFRSRYFKKIEGPIEPSWQIRSNVRNLVSFKELNLHKQFPMRGPFDVIFCRNVVIYFEKSMEEAVWSRFNAVLAPGGYLFVGHSERVSGAAAKSLLTCGVTAYRKQG
ncbi:CheR family methyltransferase [Hyphococcus sp.]|jgi:chemotaxis protein methyltransferase CheR|uniref:CheR family methyltransferase n=1 Tax=Hyphococcus sp. TaxID=2038636 RepID=UPI003D111B2D